MELIEAILLGAIQGVAEWLPISSEGMLTLAMIHLFGKSFSEAIVYALWLHIGTMLAAIVYYRKDVGTIVKDVTQFKFTLLTKFLFFATLCSLVIGGILYFVGVELLDGASMTATILIGAALIITGILQLTKKQVSVHKDIRVKDSFLAGALQGLAVLPGISRSGTTTATLLLQKYKNDQALRLSFLMSIPLVFASSIALAVFEEVSFSGYSLVAVAVSFLVGILTIDLFVKLAKKINFAYFCLAFGTLIIVAVLL